jgi:hypothetical protein
MGTPQPKRGMGLGKSVILGGSFALVMLALIWYASVSLGRQSCEVCIAYEGRSACRKAEGSSAEEARRTATDMACAVLASGMTESLQCQRTEPKSVRCGDGYAGGPGR